MLDQSQAKCTASSDEVSTKLRPWFVTVFLGMVRVSEGYIVSLAFTQYTENLLILSASKTC